MLSGLQKDRPNSSQRSGSRLRACNKKHCRGCAGPGNKVVASNAWDKLRWAGIAVAEDGHTPHFVSRS
jgi:hypothetical protein